MSLARTRWMDPASRKAAQEKLDKMFLEVAYPVEWPESVHRNDGKLQVSAHDVHVFLFCSSSGRGTFHVPRCRCLCKPLRANVEHVCVLVEMHVPKANRTRH
jgi:hypothetical protein